MEKILKMGCMAWMAVMFASMIMVIIMIGFFMNMISDLLK